MLNRKLHILYAEDILFTAQETVEALQEYGYEIRAVYDGIAAWDAFQEERPDVVLLDYQMPGMNGFEVFQRIREIDQSVPVLILSSHSEMLAASLKIGTNDFIRKDGGIEEIYARIEKAWKECPHNPDHNVQPAPIYHFSAMTIFYPASFLLEIHSQKINLNRAMTEILSQLWKHRGTFLSLHDLCCQIWDNDHFSKIKLARDYISDLRKIMQADPCLRIRNQYGKGYCMEVLEEEKE